MPEDLLIRDGCRKNIKDFWSHSGLNPTQEYYLDTDDNDGHRCWMCGWISSKDNKKLVLKTHIRRSRHNWNRKKAHLTAKTVVIKDKHEDDQENLSQVYWGDEAVDNK